MSALAVYSLVLLAFGWRRHYLARQDYEAEQAALFAGLTYGGLGGVIVSILGFIVQAVWS
jgi:hypothetical protein